MKTRVLGLFAFAMIFVLALSSCCNKEIEKAPKIALEDFFKNPQKTSYQISPDGQYFSFMAPYKDRLNIFVQKIGSDSAVRLTSEEARDLAGYFWANNERILYLKDAGGDENYALYGINIDGSNAMALTEMPGVRTQFIDDLKDIDDQVIIGLNKRIPQIFDPYRLNIETGEMEMLAENPGNIQGWMTDHEGKLRIAIGIVDGVNSSFMYRETEEDEFEEILVTSFKDALSPYFFTFDNKLVYGVSNLDRDKQVPVIFDPKTCEIKEVLFENDEYDVDGLSYSRKRKVLTYASYTGDKSHKHFFDDELKGIYANLEEKLPGYEVVITDNDEVEENFIVRTYSDKSLGAYYIYKKATDVLEKIVEVSPWIDENHMADMLPIRYQSRDGLTIHGYLTLPKGYTMETAKNLPVVINPHGGPWARDRWGFNPEIQFLANRGYVVMQMNFRGSTGFGKEFWQSSFKQWGLKMQDDISDGVQWLIDQGIADPERVAIYGASYGGYATLAGMAFTPDLYAAGVDYVGVSNLFSFMNTIPPYWEPMLKMMHEMVGDPVADSIQMRKTSPVFHADKITSPLFVAQGANDPRVNIDESDQIVKALEDKGVTVEYMVKDNEGHGFRNQENQFDFYGAMEKFLAKHLGNEEVVEE